MSNSFRKFVAILMLLWLPLFSGNTLAAMVSMPMQQGSCHEIATPEKMAHSGKAQNHHHHEKASVTADEQNSSCSSCGVCHLFCAGYLLVPSVALAAVQTSTSETIPYLVSFRSTTFAPLLPPPLARA
ncbi:MAG: DUF2946 domain-containing protein [Gallionella sp.]|nr:DUF2946 domain-containing protein [Gallionella sp.]